MRNLHALDQDRDQPQNFSAGSPESLSSLTPEEIREQFSEQHLSALSMSEYLELLKKVPPRFVTHVIRQGVRDNFSFHDSGYGELHEGLSGVVRDGGIRSTMDQLMAEGLSEQQIEKFLAILGIPQSCKTRAEALERVESFLNNSPIARNTSAFADAESVHVAMDHVADQNYGAERGNVPFIIYPGAFIASQYRLASQAFAWPAGLKLDETERTDQRNDFWLKRIADNRGILNLQAGLLFIPGKAMVDPHTGSIYALNEQGQPLPNTNQIEAVQRFVRALKEKQLWNDETQQLLNQYQNAVGQLRDLQKSELAKPQFMAMQSKLDLLKTQLQPFFELARGSGITDQRFYDLFGNSDLAQWQAFRTICAQAEKATPFQDPDPYRQAELKYTLEDSFRHIGMQYRLAENTVPSREYWENYFQQSGSRPSKIIYYEEADPNQALAAFIQRSGLTESPALDLRESFSQNLTTTSEFHQETADQRDRLQQLSSAWIDRHYQG